MFGTGVLDEKYIFFFIQKLNSLFGWRQEMDFDFFWDETFFFDLKDFGPLFPWMRDSFIPPRRVSLILASLISFKKLWWNFFTYYPKKGRKIPSKYFLIQPNKGWENPLYRDCFGVHSIRESLIHFLMPKHALNKVMLAGWRLLFFFFFLSCF